MRRLGAYGLLFTVGAACGGTSDSNGMRPVTYSQLPRASTGTVPPAETPRESPAPPPRAPTPDAPFRAQAPQAASTAAFTPPRIEDFRLPNGIRVLLVERHDLPIVAVRYVSRRGAEDAPVAKAGLASMTGALLEQGTKTRDALELSDALEALGAEHGSGVGWDSGTLYVKVLAPELAPAVELLADMVQHPAFASEEIERLRAQRLASLQQERDVPPVIAANIAGRTVYGDRYAYGRSLSGTETAVRSITRKDIQVFYRTHFVPSDGAIVVVGDTTREALTSLLNRTFGTWRATAPAARPLATPARLGTAPRIFLADRPHAPQSTVTIAQVGVPRTSRDYVALTVMNTILGGMFSSRINLNLREEHAYTYGAGSAFAFRHGSGPFSIGGAISVAHTGDAIREIFRELARIRSSEVSNAEISAAKARLTETLPARFETNDQTSAAVAELFVFGLPLNEYATLTERIQAITPADVRRVAQQYLDPDNARIVVVGDRSVIEPDLRQLGLGEIEIREPTGDRPSSPPPVAEHATERNQS